MVGMVGMVGGQTPTQTHDTALSDHLQPSPYIVHGAYYLNDRGTGPKVWQEGKGQPKVEKSSESVRRWIPCVDG